MHMRLTPRASAPIQTLTTNFVLSANGAIELGIDRSFLRTLFYFATPPTKLSIGVSNLVPQSKQKLNCLKSSQSYGVTGPRSGRKRPQRQLGKNQELFSLSSAPKAFPHVGVTGDQPDPHAARNRNHRQLKTSSTRPSASASTLASTRTHFPLPRSISIRPLLFSADRAGRGAEAGGP